MFTPSKGKVLNVHPQVVCEGDIKRLLDATFHNILMNLMFKMILLNLINFTKHNIDKVM